MSAPRVLFLSSEVVPYSKSGGLADVAGALPDALAQTGCDMTVVTPLYRPRIPEQCQTNVREGEDVTVRADGKDYPVTFHSPVQSKGNAGVVFADCEPLFARAGLYGEATGKGGYADYPDNDVRFSVFARAVLAWASQETQRYDVIHANDWQTALVCPYLPTLFADDPAFAETRTLLTIHNLAYQGVFPGTRFGVLGLDPGLFAPLSPFEFYKQVDFLKAGIHYASKINTVSPTYAAEIQSDPDLGCGLDGLLRDRSADVSGILNGIDTTVWNPAVDSLLPHRYDADTVVAGKKINKETLLRRARIPSERWDRPLVGMISRLDAQKGFDLIEEAASDLMAMELNLIVLGTGAKAYHDLLTTLGARYGDRVGAFLTFDNELAHLIEAGSDIFLMPSRYEPCGLNQMYSLSYGTVPVVRATGGLADTVSDADGDPRGGNGFAFVPYTAAALLDTLRRALAAFDDPKRWRTIQARGMKADFSWERSAHRYKELYESALTVDAPAGIHHH